MAEEDKGLRRDAMPGPFTVEFGDSKNSHQFIVGILAGLTVGGRWKRENVPAPSLGEQMAQMPDIPGQQLTVLPRERKAVLTDPLEQDQDTLKRANRIMQGGVMRSEGGGMTFAPRMDLPLEDEHQLKTLVLTMARWVKCGNCFVVKGSIPTPEQIDAMAGEEIYDPSNTNQFGHPRFVKDVPAWRNKIEMAGAV